jgi:hypothetical protein
MSFFILRKSTQETKAIKEIGQDKKISFVSKVPRKKKKHLE